MKNYMNQVPENKNQPRSNEASQKQTKDRVRVPSSFVDNRPEAVFQRKLQDAISPGRDTIQLNKEKRKSRGKMSSFDREARREARFSSTTGGGTTEFQNNENRLPTAPKGTHYIETDSGAGREDRGKRRIVSLVENEGGRVLKQYITYDHYQTFQAIR